MSKNQKNVLGGDLELCSSNPLTGWYRDGCCNTDENDNGLHTVCAKVNDDFLEWCKSAGNDLITPHPEFGFPGLKDGDNWCICASWFARAVEAGKECKIYLKKTNEKTLKIIPLKILKKHAIDLSQLHIPVSWTTTSLWCNPSNVLGRFFNITSLAMNAVLRINYKFRYIIFDLHFVYTCRTIPLCRLIKSI